MRGDLVEAGPPGGNRRNVPAPVEPRTVPALRDSYGVGTYGVADLQQEEGTDLAGAIRRFIGIALKWRKLILATAGAFCVLAAVYCFLATPLYSATVRIQIDREAGKIVEGGVTSPTEIGGLEFQKTQHELLRSRAMSERVVAAMGLDQAPDFVSTKSSIIGAILGLFSFGGSDTDGVDAQDAKEAADLRRAVSRVRNNVTIKPLAGSRLVDITYTDPSRSRAAAVANAYADAYVASNLDRRFEANSYAKVFLEDQLKQLKIRLEESEKAMLAFAEQENMVQTSDQQSIAETNLAAANAALGVLISGRIQAEQAWKQVEETPSTSLPQLLNNKVIEGLRIQRNDLKRDYEEKLETFKPSYPVMMEISNKIAAVDKQIAAEIDTVKRSLQASYDTSLRQEEQMQARIGELTAEVLELQKKSIRYSILKREVESNRSLYNNLLQRYKEVDVAGGVGTNNIFIVDRAAVPISASHPQFLKIIAIALVAGLIIGFGAAYLIEMLDDRVRTPDDVERSVGLPMLGLVPASAFPEGLLSDLGNPRSPVAEAYRSLATSLQFSTEHGLPRSIVVTSGGPAEGKSSTAIALARHFAVTGKTVLLVDADMRRPSLHDKLGHANAVGLSNYLTGMCPIQDVIQDTDVANLWMIASGPLPPNAADILGGTHIYSLISVALEMFDLVIIDSPPMLGLADAQLLGAAASATIFVVGSGQARRGLVRSALARLQMARATPLGIVLTKYDARSSSYGYGYGYGHNYGYGHDASHYSYGHAPDSGRAPAAKAPGTDTSVAA
ncbi:MAG: polysaccharide biosynthesis tyrosine autokinase [Pseudomonadota bacterium]